MNYSCGQWGSRGAGARDLTEWAVKIKHRQAQFQHLRELSCCLHRKHPNRNPTFQVRSTYRWQLHMPHNTSHIRCTGDTTVVSQIMYYTLCSFSLCSQTSSEWGLKGYFHPALEPDSPPPLAMQRKPLQLSVQHSTCHIFSKIAVLFLAGFFSVNSLLYTKVWKTGWEKNSL